MAAKLYHSISDKYGASGDQGGEYRYSFEEASNLQSLIRQCGEDFEGVTLTYDGVSDTWRDQDGETIIEAIAE